MRYFITFLIVSISASCTSLQQVDLNNDQLEKLLKPGKSIIVSTSKGERHSLRIDKYEDKVIYSQDQSFALTELNSVEIKTYSKTTKVLLVAGYIVAIAVITDAVLNGISESIADDLLFFL